MSEHWDINRPEPAVIERGKPKYGILASAGDPGIEMVMALRNIEYYNAVQCGLLLEIRDLLRDAHGKPDSENAGVSRRTKP